MFDANTPAFRQQYPNGATIYDRTGRRIANVFACNPETGEAITFDTSELTQAVIRFVRRNSPRAWRLRLQGWRLIKVVPRDATGIFDEYLDERFRRHGFWPAPLTVEAEPAPAKWNPPEFSPAELPGLTCWHSADDGVYVDSKTGHRFLRDLSGNGRHMIAADEVIEADEVGERKSAATAMTGFVVTEPRP
jgi:hypothetical protein